MSPAHQLVAALLESERPRVTLLEGDVLSAFAALRLVGAPAFKVEQNVPCDDVDRVGGVPERLPVAVVSYETRQKYIVPREGGFLVPVPVPDNWHIYKLSETQLQGVIDQLRASEGSSLDDFYRLASEAGSLWRHYYEALADQLVATLLEATEPPGSYGLRASYTSPSDKADEDSELRTSVIDEMLELDPWTFDQTESGWRSLPPDLQIEALRAYVAKNLKGGKLIKSQLPGKVLSPGIIFWHLGQALALRQSGGNKEAIDWMKCSLDPEDPQWNDYAKATIAFLEDDRVSFDEHSQGENYNKSTLDRLKSGWGRTYSEAYGGATSNEQVHEGLADTSWTNNDNETVTLKQILDLTKGIKVQEFETEKLKNIVPPWEGNTEEIEKIEKADLQYPVLILVNDDNSIKYVLDGHHRIQKAIMHKLLAVKVKLIHFSKLPSSVKRILGP